MSFLRLMFPDARPISAIILPEAPLWSYSALVSARFGY